MKASNDNIYLRDMRDQPTLVPGDEIELIDGYGYGSSLPTGLRGRVVDTTDDARWVSVVFTRDNDRAFANHHLDMPVVRLKLVSIIDRLATLA